MLPRPECRDEDFPQAAFGIVDALRILAHRSAGMCSFEPVLERQIHYFVNGASGIQHIGQRDIAWIRLASAATDKGFDLTHFGKILHARFHADFGAIVDKVQVTILTDPDEMEDLVRLPGVARKTANLVLGTAFGIPSGITVDTHAGRVARRLELTEHKDLLGLSEEVADIYSLPGLEPYRFEIGTTPSIGVGLGVEWDISERLGLSGEVRDHLWRFTSPDAFFLLTNLANFADSGVEAPKESFWTNNIELSATLSYYF